MQEFVLESLQTRNSQIESIPPWNINSRFFTEFYGFYKEHIRSCFVFLIFIETFEISLTYDFYQTALFQR